MIPAMLVLSAFSTYSCANVSPEVEAQKSSVTQNVSQVIAANTTANTFQSGNTTATALNTTNLSSEKLDFNIFDPNYKNVWWQQNFEKLPDGTIRVKFPAGSYKPSGENVGGAWFIAPLYTSRTQGTLEYTLQFADNFDFVKWGKLPWFCGGSCPRGGSEKGEWFSTRFMWRKAGALELYAYFPTGTDTKYGESFVLPKFKFVPGQKYTISQHIKLNDIEQANGEFSVSVNGKEMLKKTGVTFRLSEDVTISDVIFATFFGWNTADFATPKDTNIVFWDFEVR